MDVSIKYLRAALTYLLGISKIQVVHDFYEFLQSLGRSESWIELLFFGYTRFQLAS